MKTEQSTLSLISGLESSLKNFDKPRETNTKTLEGLKKYGDQVAAILQAENGLPTGVAEGMVKDYQNTVCSCYIFDKGSDVAACLVLQRSMSQMNDIRFYFYPSK
jgi:hypothetical protein